MDRLSELTTLLREFVHEREWEQFHDPKNLAMALASEAGELLAEYRWVRNEDADAWSRDPKNTGRVAAEAADVGIALLLLCDRLAIDPVEAIRAKIQVNRSNYPVGSSRGKAQRP